MTYYGQTIGDVSRQATAGRASALDRLLGAAREYKEDNIRQREQNRNFQFLQRQYGDQMAQQALGNRMAQGQVDRTGRLDARQVAQDAIRHQEFLDALASSEKMGGVRNTDIKQREVAQDFMSGINNIMSGLVKDGNDLAKMFPNQPPENLLRLESAHNQWGQQRNEAAEISKRSAGFFNGLFQLEKQKAATAGKVLNDKATADAQPGAYGKFFGAAAVPPITTNSVVMTPQQIENFVKASGMSKYANILGYDEQSGTIIPTVKSIDFTPAKRFTFAPSQLGPTDSQDAGAPGTSGDPGSELPAGTTATAPPWSGAAGQPGPAPMIAQDPAVAGEVARLQAWAKYMIQQGGPAGDPAIIIPALKAKLQSMGIGAPPSQSGAGGEW